MRHQKRTRDFQHFLYWTLNLKIPAKKKKKIAIKTTDKDNRNKAMETPL